MDLDKRQLQPEASASGSAADTASSLRAAALLSRKRRKVVTETPVSLPPRPAAEPSLHLDYGQDETPTSSTQSVPMKTKPEPQAERTSMTSSQMEDIEDGQIREEGEISDTETSPPPPPQRRTPPRPPKVPQSSSTAQLNNPETGKTETVQLPPLMDPAVVSPPVQSDVRSRQGNVASPEPFIFETATYRLDANHVRPGLAMTQEQYNIAKDIVLDLLGWGVPPEYLVDCGLSRHVVFYVFMELNLRLPNNLDVHGLIPYPTPEMLALLPVSPSLSSRSLLSSSAMPPPSMIPVRGPLDLAERLDTDQTDLDMSSPDRSPYVKAEPSSPSAADMAASHSLLMIEQQRRQELLARKAVIASRKARQTDPADPTTYSSDQDVDRASIPSQSVDDFLKTIEPTSQGDVGEDIVSDRSTWFFSPERMDVDEPIPGLTVTSGNSDTLSTGPSSAQSTSTSVVLPTEPNSPANLPPGSSDILRSNDTRYQPSTSTTSSDMANSFSPTPYTHSSFSLEGAHPQRRGAKRPVAADFVDFDSAAGPSRGYGGYASNGYSNGGTHPTNLLKRKSGSFAGVSGVRRCVIELSDSEEDGDSQTVGEYLAHVDAREYSPAIAGSTRLASRIGSATPSIGFAVGNGGQHTVTGNGTSPAALQEKEQEIRKMRQLIAQREELRLKKLAAW
ncbi:hypothetical protein F5I97DRAFT_1884402 [Phlebopus sp. FC_14]|nr:hypothetical protein F5I97DRAFT_1884402 [Phlebopus sp. FC_14]